MRPATVVTLAILLGGLLIAGTIQLFFFVR